MRVGLAAGLLACAGAAVARPAGVDAEQQALDIAKRAIGFRSVAGPGDQTPQLAAYLRSVLVAGGFAADVEIVPVEQTAYLVARWPGGDPRAKAARDLRPHGRRGGQPADRTRDRFTGVVENGYFYGRGATDMKLYAAIVIATLLDMKRGGLRPAATSSSSCRATKKTAVKTVALIAEQFKHAELVLNIDGGGRLSEDGRATLYLAGRREDPCRFPADRHQSRRPFDGLNERTPVASIAPAITCYRSLFADLSR